MLSNIAEWFVRPWSPIYKHIELLHVSDESYRGKVTEAKKPGLRAGRNAATTHISLGDKKTDAHHV